MDENPQTSGRDTLVPCAFGPCTCMVLPADEYCTPTCRFGIGDKREPCKCGHGECTATSGKG